MNAEVRTLPGIDAPERAAENVIEAITRVIRDLPGISKTGMASAQQGGYAYRGIEQITQAAAPLFAKHGIVFVPQVKNVEVRELTVNNKPWTDTILTVDYKICGPAGTMMIATVVGIGRDNSDKGANKALTQAFKYALIQTLCIADSKDDADGTTYEADARRNNNHDHASKLAIDQLTERIVALDPDVLESFTGWKADQRFPWPWPQSAVDAMHAELDRRLSVGGAAELAAGHPSTGVGDSATSSADAETAGSRAPRLSAIPDPDTGYEKWSNGELLAECADREIEMPASARKDRMVEALRVWDRRYAPAYSEPDSRTV